MDRIEQQFAALSRRMARLSMDSARPADTPSLGTLIARVDIAKRAYQPGIRPASRATR
jgi:hypothetical protein